MASAARSTAAACPRAPCTQDTKSVSASTPFAHGGPKPCARSKNLPCLLHDFNSTAALCSARPVHAASVPLRTCAALHTHAELRCMRSLCQKSRGAVLPPWLGWSQSRTRRRRRTGGMAVWAGRSRGEYNTSRLSAVTVECVSAPTCADAATIRTILDLRLLRVLLHCCSCSLRCIQRGNSVQAITRGQKARASLRLLLSAGIQQSKTTPILTRTDPV
jgi:hypothetical protein